MSKKFFVISDIHSFYDPMKKSLWDAGFRKTNKNHILLICGDVFDRGKDTVKVYDFIKSIPKNRRIMIKGNHEYLFNELLYKTFPEKHDFSNGTVSTFCQIASIDESMLKWHHGQSPTDVWKEVVEKVKQSEINHWINSREWKNYYETEKYIFVHSFIPTKVKEDHLKFTFAGFIRPEFCEYDPNWRTSNEWFDAVWGCPWKQYKCGLLEPENKNGKTLVCGHWHAFDFRTHLDGVEYKTIKEVDFSTYYSKDIIAIDACTALSNKCNVMVFEY